MDKLLEELECPICTDYLTIPIRQCATGHSVCGKCIEKLDNCALCRNGFTESRNITLEQLALKMKYPCANKKSGCTQMLTYPEREKHELRCTFKGVQISCPLKGCDFLGDPSSMKSHWTAKKSSSKIFHETNSSSTKLKNDSYYVNLVEGQGELFWYKCKTFNNNMYFTMQLLGKPEDASQYYFEVEFNKAGCWRRKIILGDECKSIQLSDKELFNEETCCIIGFGTLSQFVVNDFLNYTFRVRQNRDKDAPRDTPRNKEHKQNPQKPKHEGGGEKTIIINKKNEGAKPKQQKKFTPKPNQNKNSKESS